MEKITIYKSPTDMGVNMAGNCIIDDEYAVKHPEWNYSPVINIRPLN